MEDGIMKHMTLKKWLALGFVMLCTNVATAWASDVSREADHSNLFVWIFLAFCALIIVAQLTPAVMMMLGFAKGTKKQALQAVPVTADKNDR
jgi:hypothetical protein